jgi:hypothetical protein
MRSALFRAAAVAVLLAALAAPASAQVVRSYYLDPAPVVTRPVVSYYSAPVVVSRPVVSYYSAPVVSYYAAPAPVVTYYAPAPVVSYYSGPTAVTYRRGLFGRRSVTYYYP